MIADAVVLAYRHLACAIIRRAMLDARLDNGHSAEARLWLLFDPWASELLDGLGLDRRQMVIWVSELESLS